MKKKIIIIGAGGHGKVICDTILAQNKYELIGFVDAKLPIGTEIVNGYKVVESQKNILLLKNITDHFIVAIGDNKIRSKIFNTLIENITSAIIIHPSVIIGANVKIGMGTVIMANVVINSSTQIGSNSIINTGVIIDHDCVIGENSHLAIGSIVGSNSVIGENYLTKIGENICSFSKVY